MKYALLQLLDRSLGSEDAIMNLILSADVIVNGGVNTMEYVFDLVDSECTVEFGTALIMVILIKATNDATVREASLEKLTSIFMKWL